MLVHHIFSQKYSTDQSQYINNTIIFPVFGVHGKRLCMFRPDFFYFLVLGSADPIFSKTGIKIKLLSLNFIFFIAADRNFPPHSEIKYRTFFAGELCAGTPSRR